jgi:glycosyltransferase involved in cell wall biosynthesis
MKKYTLLTVMPSFSKHADRRNWKGLELFYNPGMEFKKVHIVSLGDNFDYRKKKINFNTLEIHPIKPFNKFLMPYYVFFKVPKFIDEIIRKNKIDLVVNTYGGPVKFGIPAVIAAKRNNLPSIVTMHNDYEVKNRMDNGFFIGSVINHLTLWSLRKADGIRSVSEYIKRFALKRGIPKKKLKYIPNKEDLGKFRKKPSEKEISSVLKELDLENIKRKNKIILSVGRLVKQKNYENMIRAFALAQKKQKDIVYIIVGKGKLKKKLEKLITKLKIKESVIFIDYIPHDKLKCLYHISDVFLFATWYEGQPRVIIEALLSGLPVICPDYGQLTEIIKNNEDGIWVNPKNPEETGNALFKIINDKKLQKKLSEHDLIKLDEFSIANVNKQEAEYFKKIIGDNRK